MRSLKLSSCHAKCINTRYADGDLSKGESVCIDRCVAKFFEVNKKVGEKLQAMGANAAGGSVTKCIRLPMRDTAAGLGRTSYWWKNVFIRSTNPTHVHLATFNANANML
ncbi:hypothetical protein NM688_g7971 [Phlebia brevispora]|uniref:Uncharacterized protein n=1 Tax=Phlebia brevispora TaxID=194682 RepID=A0ACC1RZ20_9APHY|nr:hypothetical protein NM688_g7971 [Phlebia brevispora]